jgi:hypothetical protein
VQALACEPVLRPFPLIRPWTEIACRTVADNRTK